MTARKECHDAGGPGRSSEGEATELDRAMTMLAGVDWSPPPTTARRGSRPRQAGSAFFLSPRLFDVLRLVAADRSDAEIAATLGLGVRIVAAYRERLMQHFGIHDRRVLVRYARRVTGRHR
jgi:DNA-binding NarL/FixJ family response regulator